MNPPPDHLLDEVWNLAHEARDAGEVPVGAIVCRLPESDESPWEVLGRGRNRILENRDPSAHAELEAVREACAALNSERLARCALITNLEPCLMCSGALVLARVEAIFYFTPVGSGFGLLDVLELPRTREKALNHSPRAVLLDSQSERASTFLRNFFRERRK